MRILIAGASGVLGRATLPHLAGHELIGLTRTLDRAEGIARLGAGAVVCDVYDSETLLGIARGTKPEVVVNFLTALADGLDANNRIRREGAANLRNAAEAAGARRLVVESVAFRLKDDAATSLELLERSTLEFRGEALVLRFGRFWGPGTFHESPPRPPAIDVATAGAEAARLVVLGSPGIHTLEVAPRGADQEGFTVEG